MARVKKRPSQAQQKQPDRAPKPEEAKELKPSILEYLVQFLIFVIFCGISALLVYKVTGYTLGLSFFFGVVILGFLVVCIFSYLHDRLYREEDEASSGP